MYIRREERTDCYRGKPIEERFLKLMRNELEQLLGNGQLQ